MNNDKKVEMLEVVDENDVVIRYEDRAVIHKEGLLHREIHIFFITPNKEIIFQHRAKDKDTYPDKLDATVAGHVEIGATYDETAIKEAKEETGIEIPLKDLVLLEKMNIREMDEDTGLINNTIRVQYAYLYTNPIKNLTIEEGKAIGFETWYVNDLLNLSEEDMKRFKPIIRSYRFLELFKMACNLLII